MDSRLELRVCGFPWHGGHVDLNLYETPPEGPPLRRIVRVSARRGAGVEEVRDHLAEVLRGALADGWRVRPHGKDAVLVTPLPSSRGSFLWAGCREQGGLFAVLPLGRWSAAATLTPTWPVEVATPDGFARYRPLRTREEVMRRLRETKEFLSAETSDLQMSMYIAGLNSGAVCGALWRAFGPPHDLHDDWKSSFSYYLDVIVAPSSHDPGIDRPVTLLLEVSDWKGGPRINLYMPRRSEDDIYLESGDEILPGNLRQEVVLLFLGWLEDRRRRRALKSFERSYPGGYGGERYGVKHGVPFDHVRTLRHSRPGRRPSRARSANCR